MAKMTLLNYADHNFRTAQRTNSRTGKEVANFDRVLSYGPEDIDAEFRERNRSILDAQRGGGYWLWKPYFIDRALSTLPDGEWLFYCDSGSYFLTSVRPVIDYFASRREDIICFEDQHPEYMMTKRAVFEALAVTDPVVVKSKQRMAGFIMVRASSRSRQFVGEWLQFSQIPSLINDELSQGRDGELAGFHAHRHDGSIYSVLTKVHGLAAYRDPSQFGNPVMDRYTNSPYQQLIQLTRQRDIPLSKRIKRWLRSQAVKLGWRGRRAVL